MRRYLLVLPWLVLAWLLAGVPGAAAVEPSETLTRIRMRGTIVVGVKTDYPPFGMLDPAGQPQGMEHDLAADLARRLGVKLVKVSVTGANRLQQLEEGAVDVVIATMADTAERRRIATIVEPSYYASGVTLFMRPEARFTEWREIRGQTVCATQGSYFNRAMSQRYLLNLLMFNNARDAKLAVRNGRCIGYLFDETAIWADLQRAEWEGYKAPLPAAMAEPWSMALARKERGTDLERIVGDTLADWHRSGFLLERERAWGLPASRFLAEASVTWSKTGDDGKYICRRDAKGQWPVSCRNRVLLTPQEVSGSYQLGLTVQELTGWNLTFIYDGYDRSRLLRGLGLTLSLMGASIMGSLALGIAAALLAESRLRLLGSACRVMAVWGRMTPPLLQMYLVFFGIGAVLWDSHGISLSAWGVAVWCLSYYTGASVMAALLDAASVEREKHPHFRLTARTVAQVYGNAAGSITASLVNVSKATMMSSVIAVPELLSVSTSILADNGNVGEVMNMLLLTFMLLVTLTLWLLQRLEGWARRRAAQRVAQAPGGTEVGS